MWEKGGIIYALHRSIQRTHHVHVQWLCKTVIHYAAINAWRDRSRRRQKEISLEYLTEENHYPLSTADKEMTEKENVTEQLKAENQMLWVQMMNSIRNRVEEVVNSEIIYS